MQDTTDWVKSKFSTLSGELDTRPGHYYVVSHRQGRRPEEGYHRLAGPWPTHKEADDQVAAVREYAERHGGQEAYFQHYITARMPIVEDVAALPSKLGRLKQCSICKQFLDTDRVGSLDCGGDCANCVDAAVLP